MEVWLRTNSRALLFGAVLPTAIALVGLLLITGLPSREPTMWMRVLGGCLVLFGLFMLAALIAQWRLPRLAYDGGRLWVRLQSGPPIGVPIEIVECFWLGQAASMLPGKRHEKTETASVVIRLAENATEWRHQEVKPELGMWCEGYITIRGTWCEPLTLALVNRLNERLAEVHRTSALRSSAH